MKVVVLLLALLLVLGHAWLSHELRRERVEALLVESLRRDLEGEPQFRGVDVEYEYLDGVLKGELPSKDMEDLVEAFAEDVRLAGRISSDIKLGPPPDQPARLVVEFGGGRFRLTGKLPDDFTRLAVEDELRLLRLGEISNEVEISNRVIRPQWDGMTDRVFQDYFREPGQARIEIAGDEVKLTRMFEGGEAKRKELLAAAEPLRSLGMKVIDDLELIRDQPVELTIVRDEKGRVRVKGQLGEAAERERLMEPLRPLLAEGGDGVELQEAVVPAEWVADWGKFAADYLKAVSRGEAKVEGNTVVLKGELPASTGKGDWVEKARAAMGPGCEVEDHLKLVPDLEPALRIGVEHNLVKIEGALPPGELADGLAKAVKEAGFDGFESAVSTSAAVKPPAWGNRLLDLVSYSLNQAGRGLQPSVVALKPGLVEVHGVVLTSEDRDRLLALSKAVVPASWALEFAVEVKSLRAPMVAGEVSEGGGKLRGLLPPEGLIEELRAFAEASERPMENRIAGEGDVMSPAWRGKFGPFLEAFFRDVDAGSFELGEQGWILAGTVATEDSKRQILAAAEKVVGPGMPMRDGLRVMVPAEPFLLVALQGADGWKLSGRVPDEATRDALRGAVPLAEMEAQGDALAVEPGTKAPAWAGGLPDFLRQVDGRLTEARVGAEQNKLTLEGKYRTMQGREELMILAKTAFGEQVLIDDKAWIPKPETTKPPRVRILLRPERVLLEGELGDAGAGDALLAGARAAVPKAELANELRVSPDFAKADWPPILGGFLPSFGAATLEGEIEVEGAQITLRGKARDEASRNALLADFAKALPNNLTLRDELEVMEQPSVEDRADTFTLYFGSASTFVSIKGKQTLAQAAAAIRAADRKTTVLVKGYADVRGDEADNLELSRDRAEEVYRELVKAGVDAKQLELIGVGEAESRARSRFDLRYDRKVEIKLVR